MTFFNTNDSAERYHSTYPWAIAAVSEMLALVFMM